VRGGGRGGGGDVGGDVGGGGGEGGSEGGDGGGFGGDGPDGGRGGEGGRGGGDGGTQLNSIRNSRDNRQLVTYSVQITVRALRRTIPRATCIRRVPCEKTHTRECKYEILFVVCTGVGSMFKIGTG